MTRARWRGDAELMLVVLIWALNISVVKISLEEMRPLAFNAVRFGGAGVVLVLLARALEGSIGIARRDWPRVLGLALVGNTAYQILFILGLARASATATALIFGTTPVVVGVLSRLTRQDRFGPRAVLGALITVAGVWLVAGGASGAGGAGGTGSAEGGAGGGESPVLGAVLIFGAVICWSIYTVMSRDLLSRYTPLRVTALTLAVGAVPLIPIALPSMAAQEWRAVGPGAWAGLFYSMIFALVICYVLWYRSVRAVGNLRTAVYSNLVPVFGAGFGIAILGESPTLGLALGALGIFGGIALVRTDRPRGAVSGAAGRGA